MGVSLNGTGGSGTIGCVYEWDRGACLSGTGGYIFESNK